MDRRDIEDLFRGAGGIQIKRMFGGHGVFADGLMFALEAGGEIYLKTDSESLPVFEARGLKPFVFESSRGEMVTSYRLLQEEAHEDPAILREWCERARLSAQRAAKDKFKRTGRVHAAATKKPMNGASASAKTSPSTGAKPDSASRAKKKQHLND